MANRSTQQLSQLMAALLNVVAGGLALLLLSVGACGCAALSNPMAEGIPAHRLPEELLAPSKKDLLTIPLNYLRQSPVASYRLAPGDVLGIYIEGFLGDRNQPLPLHVGPLVEVPGQFRLPPAEGYPVPVQDDGAITLPNLEPLLVQGLTLPETRDAIRTRYLQKKLIRPENERILVSLLHPRTYRVLVFREDSEQVTFGPEEAVRGKRNVGYVIDLPAYENDVLHALARTGGLPGLESYSEVIIFRGCFQDEDGCRLLLQQANGTPAGKLPLDKLCPAAQVIRIPLRLPLGDLPAVKTSEVILQKGDVVYLRPRDCEVFYTAGLLPPGKHILPRDVDLDVVEAIALIRGPLFNGAFGGSNLSGALLQAGIGNPSPSLLTIVRRVPDGREVSILVNLRKAMRHSEERLLVQAGDVLVLQEQPGEALARYFTQTFLNFDVAWRIFRSDNVFGVVDVAAPDRLPGRISTQTVNQIQ
jgi:hypothetical protein